MFVLSYMYDYHGNGKKYELKLKAYNSREEAERKGERLVEDQHAAPTSYKEIKLIEVMPVNTWEVKRSPRVDLIELKKT